VESFPTLVVSALMSQIGVSIGGIALVEGSSRDWPIVRAGWRRRVVWRLSATPPTIEQTDLGPVSVRIPRILNPSDKPQSFVSLLIKPFRRRRDTWTRYCLRAPGGLGWIVGVVGRIFGEESLKKLSTPTSDRLKQRWSAEHTEWSLWSLGTASGSA